MNVIAIAMVIPPFIRKKKSCCFYTIVFTVNKIE